MSAASDGASPGNGRTTYAGEEYEVVENAIKSADRYYRVLAMGPAASQASADQMAAAFKAVATSWMHQQKVRKFGTSGSAFGTLRCPSK